jgi:hypothetical protein
MLIPYTDKSQGCQSTHVVTGLLNPAHSMSGNFVTLPYRNSVTDIKLAPRIAESDVHHILNGM